MVGALSDLIASRSSVLAVAQRRRGVPRFFDAGPPEATDDPSASAWWAALESADYWPMANIILKTLGGKPKQLSAFGRELWTVSSS